MARSDERMAYDTHVLEAYLIGVQGELETKLRDLRRIRAAVAGLGERRDRVEQVDTVRALLRQFDRMLASNQVVRDTLLHLRETAHLLMKDFLNAKRS